VLILWRDGVDVPSKCTIVRTVGEASVRREVSGGRDESNRKKIQNTHYA
jgi:hypothetical protein